MSLALQYLMVCDVVRQVHVPIQVVNLYVMMVVKLQTLSARLASVATRGCVSTRVVGSLKLGMSNAKVGCVVHTFLVCYTYTGVCVLFG
jgi:hypothetical protein